MEKDKFLDDLTKEHFEEVYPFEYATKLKIRFIETPSLWYQVIVPPAMADKLRKETNGDYSIIWHEHCNSCFTNIDKSTKDKCYVSSDKLTWLCTECYNKLFKINN